MAIVSDYFIHVGYDFLAISMHVWNVIQLHENSLLLNSAVIKKGEELKIFVFRGAMFCE